VAVRPSNAPSDAPFHAIVRGPAAFSWRATYEPFRKELPASATEWVDFGCLVDEAPAKELVRAWQRVDSARLRPYLKRGRLSDPEPPDGRFVGNAIVKAGYFDLAVAAVTGSAVSIDRRHQDVVVRRIEAGDAQRVGGQYALEVLLPDGFGWDDVPDLRAMRALRDYRAIIREVEEAALTDARNSEDLQRALHAEYAERLAKATARGVPFKGRVALAFMGFVVGGLAETAAPVVGSATVGVASFGAAEAADRLMRPRWLSVHRRALGRRPEGI
jgi:hypothetical protein